MSVQKIVGVFAGALIVLSVFLPWINKNGEILISGFQNSAGISEGVIVLILAVLIIACSIIVETWAGLVVVLTAVYLILNIIGILKVIADFNLDNSDRFAVGEGIVLQLIMAILLVLNGLIVIFKNRQIPKK